MFDCQARSPFCPSTHCRVTNPESPFKVGNDLGFSNIQGRCADQPSCIKGLLRRLTEVATKVT